jgi:putative ABC transport system permease protein
MRVLWKLMGKNLRRRPARTVLTVLGVASAFMLFMLVESLSAGLDRAMSGSEAARTLIVYRQNRYCPQTSFLPEHYAQRIEKIPGVQSVLPVKIFLNNCRASLDLIAFHGAPVDKLDGARKIDVIAGDYEAFKRDRGSAIVGRAFAKRRGIDVGQQFKFGAINVKVAGVFASAEPVEEGVVITHLEYLQRAGPVNKLGTVTEFDVKIDDAAKAKGIARQIDDLFRTADSPTDTRLKVQFLESATRDLAEILRFGRILGMVCVAVVLVLVGNTVVMSVQERTKEFAVFMTLGYKGRHLLMLVIGESLVIALIGAAIGLTATLAIIRFTHLTISSEGVSVGFTISRTLILEGVLVSVGTGLVAGIFPAVRTARAEIVGALRGL